METETVYTATFGEDVAVMFTVQHAVLPTISW